jgi:zinc protease
MMKEKSLLVMLVMMMVSNGWARTRVDDKKQPIQTVLLPGSSPLVSFRILLNVGAASDPKGKEGVAALTAAMLSQGGSRDMTYEQIVQAMYPMATSFQAQVDKEMTVFYGTTHRDNLERYYQIISTMLLNPGWRADDFTRLKTDAINFLKVNLRSNNDEELGKEALYNFIYEGHPYGHHNIGTVSALEKMTVDDVKAFYRQYYTQANLVMGLSGGYPSDFPDRVRADLQKLPVGTPVKLSLPQPKPIDGLKIEVIQKETRATAISFGFPIPVNRSHPDWPALWLVASYFGEHRSSNGLLYNRLREIRGLNYGDYAYIEYFPRGMFQFHPDPNLGRQQQIFQVWIRPVEPANGHFALRLALYELKRLVDQGMTQDDFEETRQYLSKFVNLLVKTQDRQLGYALDSRYYGVGEFTDYVRQQLAKLTLEEVNRVIKKYLQYENIKIVVITKDADDVKQAVASNRPSPIKYNAPKPQEILEEDKIISNFKLNVEPAEIEIVPVDQVFQ